MTRLDPRTLSVFHRCVRTEQREPRDAAERWGLVTRGLLRTNPHPELAWLYGSLAAHFGRLALGKPQ